MEEGVEVEDESVDFGAPIRVGREGEGGYEIELTRLDVTNVEILMLYGKGQVANAHENHIP